MIPRQALEPLHRLARGFPIVALTGPRQSGKTTLARAAFAGKPYVSLEYPQERAFAETDPQRFLGRFAQGAVLDEVQRCPQLLSWLQGLVDERRLMGDFVLTGSAQFDLLAGITQSLAGRVGRVELLPLSAAELSAGDRGCCRGATPRCTTARCRQQTGLPTTWPAMWSAMSGSWWPCAT